MQDGPPKPPPTEPSGTAGARREGLSGAEFAGVGVQFAGAIVLFLFVGQWVDKRFGTQPFGVIVGVFTGAGGAFYSMYRKLMAAQRADDARRAGGTGGTP